MAEHTKEPWLVIDADNHHGTYIENSDGDTICDLYVMDRVAQKPIEQDNAENNARRIVACVNACVGYTNEELENHPQPIMTQLLNQRDKLEQQRNALLEELKNIAECDMSKWAAEFKTPADFKLWAQNRARLAIANAEAA
jgi:hypothetical protein